MKKALLVLTASLALFSCSVKGGLTLDSQGAGTMDMDFTLLPFFGDFFFDLVDEDLLLADTDRGLAENKGITDHTLSREDYRYSGKISFSNFEDVVAGEDGEEQTIFTMETVGGQTTLRITFTRDNWDQMSVLVPVFSDPTVAMLGPSGSIGLSEEEYREMVIYPFEGYASSTEEASRALDSSSLVFTVNVPGPIIGQQGGEVSGRSVTFRIPLIRMLMLDEELSYSVTYRQE